MFIGNKKSSLTSSNNSVLLLSNRVEDAACQCSRAGQPAKGGKCMKHSGNKQTRRSREYDGRDN